MSLARLACVLACSVSTFALGQGMSENGLQPITPDAPAPQQPQQPPAPQAPAGPQQPQVDANWSAGLVVGSRLSYRNSSAMVYGRLEAIEPGGFPATGGSAQSIVQGTVVALTPQYAVFDVRTWLQSTTASGFTSLPAIPMVATPTQGTDFWRSPADLERLQEGEMVNQTGKFTVRRMEHTLNGKAYRAIRISDYRQTEKSWRTYDLETGVLLSYSLAGTVAQREQGKPDVALIQQDFIDRRDLQLPYTIKPVPAALQKKTIRLSGETSMRMDANQGMQPPAIPINLTLTVEKFNGEMLLLRSEGQQAAMPYLASAYYLDPQQLGRLQPGQEFDRDPHTSNRLYVAGVGNGAVVLAEEGALERLVTAYDLRTGLVVGGRKDTSSGASITTLSFKTEYAD